MNTKAIWTIVCNISFLVLITAQAHASGHFNGDSLNGDGFNGQEFNGGAYQGTSFQGPGMQGPGINGNGYNSAASEGTNKESLNINKRDGLRLNGIILKKASEKKSKR